MKKRIAIFVPSMRGGGAERAMLTLANGFSNEGFDVDLVLAKAEGPFLSEISNNVRVIDFKKNRVLFALPDLIHYLRKEKPFALLSTLNHSNIIAILAGKLSGTSAKIILGQANILSLNPGGRSELTKKSILFLVRRFYPLADKIVGVSKGVADDLITVLGIPAEKVISIYDPVVTEALFEKAEETLNHPWFLNKECPVILGVGRLTEVKNFQSLIEAIALIRQQRPVKLLILGEGQQRKTLEEQIRENNLTEAVSLPGFVQNPFPFMKHADVFALSSLSEGLSNALIQSLALGTRTVSTDCPTGPREVLEAGRWGILVPMKDPQSLAEGIISTLDNNIPFDSSAAKKHCITTFGMNEVVHQYINALNTI